jgi:hypothetical protein
MLRRPARQLSVAAVVAAVCSMTIAGASFAPNASADQTISSTQNIPFNTGLFNPCNGQIVSLAGFLHVTINATQTPSGTLNATVHVDWSDVKGTDPLGNTYVIHNADNDSVHFSGQGGVTQTASQQAGLVTTGSAQNLTMDTLFHITINPNGSFTAFVDTVTSTCSS